VTGVPTIDSERVRSHLDNHRAQLVDDLATLVSTESPSLDVERLTRSAQVLSDIFRARLGSPATLVDSPRGPHVHWRGGGTPRVLIVGHHDTVFPAGTVAARPFACDGERATGPGVFDMKAGIIQAIHGVAALGPNHEAVKGVEFLITSDEEVGSHASRALLEERAKACSAVLVLEPSADGGALKIARKGTGTFIVKIHGRAAHAGLEPHKGVNALVEAAEQVRRIVTFGNPALGTTVTPTVAKAGTADNVVPDYAEVSVDVRCESAVERERIESAFASLTAVLPDARITVDGGMNRPPLPAEMTAELFALARTVAPSVGIADLQGVAVGGGSDGNLTAAVGVRTLDGLGAVGGGAHAESEHVIVAHMPERAALIAALVAEIARS
jgi:glutamate carboxypeptidase